MDAYENRIAMEPDAKYELTSPLTATSGKFVREIAF